MPAAATHAEPLAAAFELCGDHPHHAVAHAWLVQALAAAASGAAFTVMPMVLASFLRLVTSPRVFQPKSGSYPDAASPGGGLKGPMTGAIRSLT